MCLAAEYFLKARTTVRNHQITLSTTPQQVFGYAPNRFAYILTAGLASVTYYTWGDYKPTAPSVILNGGNGALTFSRDVFGDLVTYPCWVWVNSGTPAINVIASYYDPERQALYERIVHEHISKYLTS